MLTMTHIDFGLRSPLRVFPLPHPPKPSKFSSSNAGSYTLCSASKWADRLISDFQFTSAADSSPLSATSVTLTPPPPLSPPDRHLSLPIDFYKVCLLFYFIYVFFLGKCFFFFLNLTSKCYEILIDFRRRDSFFRRWYQKSL